MALIGDLDYVRYQLRIQVNTAISELKKRLNNIFFYILFILYTLYPITTFLVRVLKHEGAMPGNLGQNIVE